jgi:hypothetical protein
MYLARPVRAAAAVAAVLLAPTLAPAQPVLNQVDTFQDGTTMNWAQGVNPGGLSVQSGGQGGAADLFLHIDATGGAGVASRLVAFNRSQWQGNYIAAGITAIEMDLLSPTTSEPLQVRIAFRNALGVGYSSTTAFTLPNDGQWRHAVFFLAASEMTPINTTEPFESFISTIPSELRILHSESPNVLGDVIDAELGVDNIRATAAPVPEPGMILAVAAAGVVGWSVRRARRGS